MLERIYGEDFTGLVLSDDAEWCVRMLDMLNWKPEIIEVIDDDGNRTYKFSTCFEIFDEMGEMGLNSVLESMLPEVNERWLKVFDDTYEMFNIDERKEDIIRYMERAEFLSEKYPGCCVSVMVGLDNVFTRSSFNYFGHVIYKSEIGKVYPFYLAYRPMGCIENDDEQIEGHMKRFKEVENDLFEYNKSRFMKEKYNLI